MFKILKHRANSVAALLSNWQNVEAAVKSATEAEGSAARENAKYVDSIQGRLDKLTTAWQSFANTFMESDFLKGAISGLTKFVELIEKLVDSLGSIGTLSLGVGIFSLIKSGGLKAFIKSFSAFSTFIPTFGTLGEKIKGVGLAIGDAGRFAKKSMGSFSSLATGVGIAITALSLIYNWYKKNKEEQAKLRQETIQTADVFLDSASSFEHAYIKYSGKTNLTVEEEVELESAIKGTVDALGDKSSALQDVVNSSNDYVASLERIAKEELKVANRKAQDKLDAAEKELKESAIGWTGFDGSEVDIKFGTYLVPDNEDVVKAAKKIGEKYYETFNTSNYSGSATVGFELPANANIDQIVDYYNTLVEYKDELRELGLEDTTAFDNTTKAISKMEDAVGTYIDALYDASKLEYEYSQNNGIPKTVEEYLKMRESILNSEGVNKQSLSTRLSIANTLDAEYKDIFDFSSVEVQARKFIGLIKDYNDGTKDGINEIGTIETFLNMKTAVNNNECSVGNYLSQFDKINEMTENWSDEEKELLNSSFGLDTDTIKQQYDEMQRYLRRQRDEYVNPNNYNSIFDMQRDIERANLNIQYFLDSLTADELAAVIDIRTEIDWENTSAEDIRKQIEEQANLNKALNFEVNIETDITALETLNDILAESASAMGLSSDAIDSLKSKYADLDSYDPSTLFEATGNGVKVNREELEKLEKEYNDLTKTKVQKHLDTLVDKYNDVTAEIDKCTNAGERAELLAERETYADKIEELATYQAQLEGVTGAYQDWINAQNTPEDYEGYEAVATSREDIESEIDRGFIGNSTKKYIDLLSGEDLDGKSVDDYAEAWEKLDKKVTGAGYSVNDFFTVNDDGDITSTGIDRFFKSLQTDFKGSVANFDKETKKWSYDFGAENLEKIKEKWGIGIEAIELLLEAAASAGYDIDWDGILDGIDLDTSNFETLVSTAEAAQTAFNKLEGIEDVNFNFTATGVEEATSELEKARSTYIDLITNKDGTINLNAKGAEEMRIILATLLIQKQQLEDSNIAINVDTSGLDKSQQDIANAINAVKNFREKYKNLEIAVTTGQGIEEAKTELNTAMTELQGLGDAGVDIAAELILGEGATAESLNSKVNAAISAVGSKDIKVGCKLDETALGTLNSQVLANFTPEATVKITGIDDSLVGEYTATEKTANGKVKWDNDTSLVVEFQSKTQKAKGIVDWANNVEKVKTSFSAAGTVKWTSGNNVKVKVVSEANGTANANGTTSGRAFARGNWGIKGNGVALGGELGQELVVRDGKFFTIGDKGAEFFQYRHNDIVFNAAQTESLFKYGGIKGAKPRGTMLASGSAFPEGNAFAWSATGSSSKFALNRLSGLSSATKSTKSNSSAKTKTETAVKDNSVKTVTETTWGAKATESDFTKNRSETNKPSTKDTKSTEKEFEEVFDWVETAIKRIEREIDNLDRTASSTYKSWAERNEALTKQIGKVGEEIALQEKAYQKYMAAANAVGLSSSWINKIKNGAIDIDTITDETLAEKIKDYQKWYELALDCQDAIEELKEKEYELYTQKFDNIVTKYEGVLDNIEHQKNMIEEYMAQYEGSVLNDYVAHDAKSYQQIASYYQELIRQEQLSIVELEKEKAELIAALNAAVANGLAVGGEEWNELNSQINDVELQIAQANTAIIEGTNNISKSYVDAFDNVSQNFDNMISIIEHKKNMIEEGIAQSEAQGWLVSKEYYNALASNERENITKLQEEKAALLSQLETAMVNGGIEKGSQAWHDMIAEIDSVTLAIEQGETALLEYAQAMQQIEWEQFDLLQDKISAVTEEADFLIDLMSNKKLHDDNGQLTNEGKATMGLHGSNYNVYMHQADLAGEEASRIKAQMASDPFDTELEERYREMISLQQQYILAAEDEKNAIRDMVENGIEYELDALQEKIDLYNDALDSQRDLYEYQKKVEEQTKNLASLQKQFASIEQDDSEEAKARKQELIVAIQEAEDDLEETEYDKYISDQQKLLDSLFLEYETILNERLDNIDYLIESMIAEINADAGLIGSTIEQSAADVGYTISDEMQAIWAEGNNAIALYTDKLAFNQTNTYNVISGIKSSVDAMISKLDSIAAQKAAEANKSSAADSKQANVQPKKQNNNTGGNKVPTTPVVDTKKEEPKKEAPKTGTGNGTPEVGDKVKFLSGQYYYSSDGSTPLGSKYQGKEVYITKINTANWATHPIHISTGKTLGSGDLGWLKKNQISGYAAGKKNILNNEMAWTQENGQEYIIRPSDGAILTPVAKGDSVLTSAATNNIWSMANNPAEFIKDNLSLGTTNVPNNPNIQNSYTQYLDNVVFNFPNVKNYDEMIAAMQKDPNFERLVESMSIGKIAGKSSLAKGKAIR